MMMVKQNEAGHYIYNIVFFKCRAQLFGSVHCSGHTGILARGLVENAANTVSARIEICEIIKIFAYIKVCKCFLIHNYSPSLKRIQGCFDLSETAVLQMCIIGFIHRIRHEDV